MATTKPVQHLRRSMIYRVLTEAGAQFEVLADTAVAMRYADGGDEVALARRMGLADLSPLSRTGFKGRDTPDWLVTQQVAIPDGPGQARRQSDGALVLRLSADEHVIISDLEARSELPGTLEANWRLSAERMCYHMPRAESYCWFAITGERAPEMLAKVCGVDLRVDKFDDGRIAQTSLARINAVIVRNDLGATPALYVLADSASADYLWPCLVDAMQEFEGGIVGLAALRALV
ncbi:MAG: sarcosine oxidase [Acidiferrobacterales bacterium]